MNEPLQHHILLINKNAARPPDAAWINAYRRAAKEAKVEITILESNKPELFRQDVSALLRQRNAVLISVGGDGTLHHLVNVIFNQKEVACDALRVSCIPAGSGNDWVKTHGIPRSPGEAFRVIQHGRDIAHDVGRVQLSNAQGNPETFYFINALGSFVDGWVVYNLQRKLVWLPHSMIYWWGLIRSLPTFRYSNCRIEADHMPVSEGRHILVNAGICKFAGGGMQITPHARPDDGNLAITLAGKLSLPSIIRAVPRILKGNIHQHPGVKTLHAGQLNIMPLDDHPVHVEADGEYMGTAPATITIMPGALRARVAGV